MTESEHFLPIDGGMVYAKAWTPDSAAAGKALPILLLHDSLGCVDMWRDFPAQLAATTQRTVIAYDRAGFGRSDARNSQLRPDFTAREADTVVPQLLDQLGITQFIACGHSIGGGIAIEIAASLPARCQAIIPMAAQSFVEDKTLEGIRAAKINFQNPALFKRLEKFHGAKAQWVLSSWVDTWLSDDFADWNLCQALVNVTCPLLVIHGDRDEYGSLQFPDMICALSTGPATRLVLHDCGHIPHKEKKQDVLAAIAAFLSALP